MEGVTDQELRRRRQSVDSSLGSMALEGLYPDPMALGVFEDFAAGRIDEAGLARAVEGLVEHHRRKGAEAHRAA